MEEMICRKAKC